VDISRAPEFLLLFITVSYVILFAVLYAVEPSGVPLLRLDIHGWDYPYYVNFLFCVLIVATLFALLGAFRLFTRKKKNIEPKVLYFFKGRSFDMYWMFILASLVLMACVGLVAAWITQDISYFLAILFLTLFLLAYLNAYLYYIRNDFDVFQNIEAFNVKIRKHNKNLVNLKKRVVNIQKDLENGDTKSIGTNSAGLAQSILKNNKQRKKTMKINKKIKLENLQLEKLKTTVNN